MRSQILPITAAVLVFMASSYAQGRGAAPARSPKDGAPFDITGYWVSIVSEDWRFRMFTPAKGDFPGFPLNPEGVKVAQAWDPAKDESAGNQCKAYGAAAIMRVPGRFHITWDNDTTLHIDTDAGTQTRLLHFNGTAPQGGAPQLQGYSVARWERQLGRSRGGEGQPGAGDSAGGTLKVVTTNLRAGYLRSNGVPYSEKTTLTEYYDLLHEPDGTQWLIVKTIVDDPQYLTRPFLTSTNLRKQPNANGWSPSPCR